MEYERDTQCEGCHCWYDRSDLFLGHGGVALCQACYDATEKAIALAYADEPLNSNPHHEGEFEDEPCADAVQVTERGDALMTRTAAGLRVEAVYTEDRRFGVAVTLDGQSVWASVTADTLRDAFDHPAMYLSPEQCAQIGLR